MNKTKRMMIQRTTRFPYFCSHGTNMLVVSGSLTLFQIQTKMSDSAAESERFYSEDGSGKENVEEDKENGSISLSNATIVCDKNMQVELLFTI